MARTGVSYEEIERVATKLYQQGLNPTVQRVRSELGTGSNTTISRHLKTWQETFFEESPSRIPMVIPDDIAESVDSFWSAAVAKADANYQQFREETENQRDLAIEEKEDALLHLQKIQQQNQQLQSDLAEAQQVNKEQTSELQRLQGQYAELNKNYEKIIQDSNNTKALANTAMEQANQAKQTVVSQLDDQKTQYEHTISDLKQLVQSEKARYETFENRHFVKVDELQQTIKQNDQRIYELDKELSDQQSLNNANQRLFDQQLKQLTSKDETTNQQLKRARDENTSLQQELKIILSNYQTWFTQNENIADTCTQSVKNHDIILDKIGRLESKITSILTFYSKPNQDDT